MATLASVPLDRPVSEFLQNHAVTLRAHWTVDQAIAHLRGTRTETAGNASAESSIFYSYVLNDGEQLVGVVPVRRLLLSAGTTPLSSLIEIEPGGGLVTLLSTDTLFTACELFAMHRLLALPVLDAVSRRFLGTVDVSIYTDEIFDLARRKTSDDLFQLIGLHLEQTRNATLFASYKQRMPWLLCNIAGGLACAFLASLFDRVLQEVLLIALFIPIMLTLAESISIQSMTLALQSAAANLRLGSTLRRELGVSALLAATSALLVAVTSLFWKSSPAVPVAIGLSLAFNMVLAAGLGQVVPRIISRLKLNPTLASGPLVLALADTSAITVYLLAATVTLLPG